MANEDEGDLQLNNSKSTEYSMKESIFNLLSFLQTEIDKGGIAHKTQQVLGKIHLDFERTEYKEIVKEGRNERKQCHQLIIDVEKLMYKMNSLLLTE